MVSCAEKESDFVPLAEQKAKAFEEVFKELYGEIDPYQDWGFSSGKITIDPNDSTQIIEVVDVDGDIAYTRTVPFGGMDVLLAFNPRTRDGEQGGEDKRLNEWGDPLKNNGKAYDVPDALSEQQKYRVQRYFQTHPNLTYEDPGYTTFFVQQVYKGGSDPYPGLSTETYTLGNGDVVTGSNYMDHLTFGKNSDGTAKHHCNDFNKGDWNLGKPYEVLNTGFSANDYVNSTTHVEGKTHPDKITLMVNSSTECVGFWESSGSVQHNDCCALVSAEKIDEWADAQDPVVGEKVKDKWNRSFVGLDYEAADPYYRVNGNKVAAKLGEIYNDVKYAWTGKTFVKFDDAMRNKTLKQYFNLAEEVYYLNTNTSMWAGTASNYSQQSDITMMDVPKKTLNDLGFTENVNEKNTVLDLTKIKDKLDAHCLPVYGKGFQDWCYDVGARDYYFTDWIVTLTNAGEATVGTYTYETNIDEWTQIESGRVFCEDLGQSSREDLDFNDVVFDATIWSNYTYKKVWWEKKVNGVVVDSGTSKEEPAKTTYYANVKLLAAGGTIPITVAGKDVHAQFDKPVSVETMVNTRDNKSTTYGSYVTRNPVDLKGNNMVVRKYRKVSNNVEENQTYYTLKVFKVDKQVDGYFIKRIPIVSSVGDAKQILELQSIRGTAPRKFMAPIGTKWLSERKNISLAYPLFGDWVQGKATLYNCFSNQSNINNNYTYDEETPYSESGMQLPLVMKSQSTITTDGEEYLWSGELKYDDVWNLKDTQASLVNQERENAPAFEKFYPGDRLRFRAKLIKDDAWISVSVGDITPYFIDSEFPNYVFNANGSKESREEGCVEVLLDESSAATLNNYVSNGKITFRVQGRNFTLTGITRVLFQ